MSDNLTLALELAGRGWYVFPCNPDKTPKTAHGWKDATQDPDKIRAYWQAHPGALIGIACEKSGFFALDLDRKPGGPDGLQAWAELVENHGGGAEVQAGPIQLTPSGGYHVLFELPSDLKIPNNAGKLAPGIDLRSAGYICSGGAYQWQPDHGALSMLTPAPAWLLELIRTMAERSKLANKAEQPRPVAMGNGSDPGGYWLNYYLQRAAPGCRNEQGFYLACQLRDSGLSESEASGIMASYAARVPGSDYSETEALASLRSAYQATPREAAHLPGLANRGNGRGLIDVLNPDFHKQSEPEPPDNFEADPQDESAPKRRPTIGEKIPPEAAEAITARARAIPCPDPALIQRITGILTAEKVPVKIKRQAAGSLILSWLTEHGEFVRSENDELFYLYRSERKLYNLLTNHWRAWLYSLTGANPAGTDYAFFQADCETAAMLANIRPVLRLAAWDKAEKVLRVSRFDGTIYRLDGETIAQEGNGESVLFDDSPFWQPYEPDFSRPGVFSFMADSYFDGDQTARERYKLALRVWQLSIFFTDLCPTRPALVINGEKGSGKSMTIRRFLRSLFGHNAELSGVPDKQDGFTAAAAAAHILAIDNLDEFHGWMRDKIARLTTGGVDEYRRLYTSNEVGRVVYRCWLAFTSRTPDTLRRDDLADRLILLPVRPIPQQSLRAERSFLDAAEVTRNAWWGDILTILNRLVADIRAGKLENRARLRMADWESLGRLVAAQEGSLALWDDFVTGLQSAQTDFLLDGELVAEELLEWLEKHPEHYGAALKSSWLYDQLSEGFSGHKPPQDWPKSAKSFGRRLQMIRQALTTKIQVTWHQDKYTGWAYTFEPKERGE